MKDRTMSRPIKFRAWEKSLKEMIIINNLDFENQMVNNGYGRPWRFLSEVELMQFTGLKDCYSKEIYEGDLVRDKYGALYEVCWIDTEVSFEFAIRNEDDNIDYDFARCNALSISFSKVEVVGNIYENPKLMGKL